MSVPAQGEFVATVVKASTGGALLITAVRVMPIASRSRFSPRWMNAEATSEPTRAPIMSSFLAFMARWAPPARAG